MWVGRFQSWEGGGRGRTDGWTDAQTKVPLCSTGLRLLLGRCPASPILINYHWKQGNGYCWPHIALGRPVIGRVSGPTINFIPNLKCICMLDFLSIFVFLFDFFPLITVFDGRPGCPRVTWLLCESTAIRNLQATMSHPRVPRGCFARILFSFFLSYFSSKT